jgi:two-component system cell cycle response regulator
MVFDIDNFKTYNDLYGHEAGDQVLCETVELLRATIRRGDYVFRIGGDEFVVIFSDTEGPRGEHSAPPESVEQIAHRFQAQVCDLRFPQLGVDAPGTLSISAGLATFPWDGHDGPSLLRHADQLALESKRSGKNAITFGPGARSRCRDDEYSNPSDKG